MQMSLSLNIFIYTAITSLLGILLVYEHRKESHYTIIIGILSSRDHFEHRRILRRALKKEEYSENVLVKFIVSKHACKIPIEQRIDQYQCTTIHQSKDHSEVLGGAVNPKDLYNSPTDGRLLVSGVYGVDFVVVRPVTITELGVYDHGYDGIKQFLTVTLYNISSQQKIVSKSFTSFSPGYLDGAMRYKSIQTPFLLEKGFMGSLVVEGVSEKDPVLLHQKLVTLSDSNVIYKKHIRGECVTDEGFPTCINNYESKRLVGPSMKFVQQAKVVQSKKNTYREEISRVQTMLAEEIKQHHDIVLVDVVESYRNLTLSMLRFYDWLDDKNFDFFMKSDDDCFINTTALLQMLDDTIVQDKKQNLFIGNFRQNFAVEQHGKWGELEYTSLTYPPFPCGSGYLLSKDLAKWIADNSQRLKTYQGEDVSVGIWLASLSLFRVNELRFQCYQHSVDALTSPNHELTTLTKLFD